MPIFNPPSTAAVISSSRVQVANRCGFANLVQANAGTAGLTGKGSLSYGNCGLKTVPIATAGSGMTPGVYALTISGGTPTTTATGTYTVGSGGTCTGTTITFPGIGYNTVPTVTAGGAPGGTLPTFTSPTIGATANEFNSYQTVTLTEDVTDLVLELGNFMPNGTSPGQTDNGPSTVTLRVGIRPSTIASAFPVFGLSGRSIVLEPGETMFTKPLAGPWAKGTVLIIQIYAVYASVPTNWPVFTGAVQSLGSEVSEFGTQLTDASLGTTAIAGAVHASNYALLPPIAVLGKPLITTSKKVVMVGDSIFSTGSNDSGSGGYVGFGQRTFGANYATINIGASGYGVVALMSNTTNASRTARQRKWLALADSGCTHAFTDFGTNDISGQATDISAQVVAALQLMQTELAYFGIKLLVMTCCPRTNTTNNGVNAADTAAGWTNVTALNAAIIAAFPGLYYDLNAFMRDPGNANIWNTTRNPGSVDGIHPSFADHVACADVNTAGSFAAALPALLA